MLLILLALEMDFKEAHWACGVDTRNLFVLALNKQRAGFANLVSFICALQ